MADYINFAHQGELTPDVVSREYQRLMFRMTPYSKIMKKAYRRPEDLKNVDLAQLSIDTAIAMFIDLFQKSRTDVVRIPTVDRFTGAGVTGDPTLIGSSDGALAFLQTICYVVPLGKEFPKNNAPGNKLRTPQVLDLMMLTKDGIARWFSDMMTEMITRTWFEGYPQQIYATAAEMSGYLQKAVSTPLGKGRVINPNFWVANQAEVTRSVTLATDDGNISTALALLDVDGADAAKFGSDALGKFAEFLNYKDVQKSSVIDNHEVWDIFVSPEQRRQAGEDDKILAANRYAWTGQGNKEPELLRGSLLYNGFRIIEDPVISSEVHCNALRPSTGTDVAGYRTRFGPMDADERYEFNFRFTKRSTDLADRNLKGAVVLTPGAMLSGMVGGVADEMVITPSDDNRTINIYPTQFVGFARNDKRRGTSFASPDEILNQTSAVLVTNSPAL